MINKKIIKDSDKPKKKKISKQVFLSPDGNYKRKWIGYDDGSEKGKQVRTIKGIFKGVKKIKLPPMPNFDNFPETFEPHGELAIKKKGGTRTFKKMTKKK